MCSVSHLMNGRWVGLDATEEAEGVGVVHSPGERRRRLFSTLRNNLKGGGECGTTRILHSFFFLVRRGIKKEIPAERLF